MNREKAIHLLDEKIACIQSFINCAADPEKSYPESMKFCEALDLAIAALREQKSSCAACGYGGKHLDAPPCTTCPAHPKLESNLRVFESTKQSEAVTKWISVKERLPEEWRAADGNLANYMVYMPKYGVDIGNYAKPANKWLCMGLPAEVTHWMPLPEPPKEET